MNDMLGYSFSQGRALLYGTQRVARLDGYRSCLLLLLGSASWLRPCAARSDLRHSQVVTWLAALAVLARAARARRVRRRGSTRRPAGCAGLARLAARRR